MCQDMCENLTYRRTAEHYGEPVPLLKACSWFIGMSGARLAWYFHATEWAIASPGGGFAVSVTSSQLSHAVQMHPCRDAAAYQCYYGAREA